MTATPESVQKELFTFRALDNIDNLSRWTGRMQSYNLRLVDIMDTRTLTKFVSKSSRKWIIDHALSTGGGYASSDREQFPPTNEQLGVQPEWRTKYLKGSHTTWSRYCR